VGALYRKCTNATHQSCLAHLLHRSDELLGDAQRGQAKTPHAVRRILQQTLAIRDARDTSRLEAADAAAWAERLDAAVDKLIAGRTAYPPNRRLLAHLAKGTACAVHLSSHPRGPGDQLARRARHPPRRGQPQDLGWQPHLGWGRGLADPGQRPAHRYPAAPRPNRAAGRAAARTPTHRGQPRHPHPSAWP
jgi:hypothetical protein